jgi:hypothetical protein
MADIARKLSEPYKGVAVVLGRYWRSYGGLSAFILSPYLHVALFLTAALSPYWLEQSWWTLATNILPSVLGFSLGGFAIWLGLGDDDFRTLITRRPTNDEPSPYMEVSSAFVHFVAIQMAALLAAIIAQATQFTLDPIFGDLRDFVPNVLAPIGYAIGFLLFLYSLLSVLATALAVFRVASWFDMRQNN